MLKLLSDDESGWLADTLGMPWQRSTSFEIDVQEPAAVMLMNSRSLPEFVQDFVLSWRRRLIVPSGPSWPPPRLIILGSQSEKTDPYSLAFLRNSGFTLVRITSIPKDLDIPQGLRYARRPDIDVGAWKDFASALIERSVVQLDERLLSPRYPILPAAVEPGRMLPIINNFMHSIMVGVKCFVPPDKFEECPACGGLTSLEPFEPLLLQLDPNTMTPQLALTISHQDWTSVCLVLGAPESQFFGRGWGS